MARPPIIPPRPSAYIPTGRPRGRPPKIQATVVTPPAVKSVGRPATVKTAVPVAVTPRARTVEAPARQAPSQPAQVASPQGALYSTLSLLGLTLAALRSHDVEPINIAYSEYLYGFLMDMQKYNIHPPGMQLDRIRGYAVQSRWKESYTALKEFSNSFSVELRKAVGKDASVKAESVSLLNTFLDMIAVRSPEAWGKLESTALNKLKYLNNEGLNQLWRVHIEGDQSDEMSQLKGIVSQIRGRDIRDGEEGRMAYLLTYPEKVKLRESNPELNKKYNAAANSALKKYRGALRNWILDKGNNPQPIPKAREYMEAQGYLLHDLPEELDMLLVGSDSYLYTKEGNKIANRPAPGAIIMGINPAYSPERSEEGNNWVFQYKMEDDSEPIYAYAELFRQGSRVIKVDKIDDYSDEVYDMHPKWAVDLKNSDVTTRRLAAITDILFLKAARIGGVGNNTKGVGNTYGISTLQIKHVKVRPNGIRLEYLGKKGQKQVHDLLESNREEKLIIDIIKAAMVGKKPDDNLWTDDKGKDISANDVRAYFRRKGIPVTPHSMRSIRGSREFSKLANAPEVVKKKFEQTEGEKWFKQAAEKVGDILGHRRTVDGKSVATGATVIAAGYISFGIAQDWFKSKNLRVPLFLKQLGDSRDID